MLSLNKSSSTAFNKLKPATWVVELESSDSRLHKEAVIEKALVAANVGSVDAQAFLHNCRLALNPFIVFGVKKVPETKDIVSSENPWLDFWELCQLLATRDLTGHAARDAIAAMSQRFDSSEWNGLARRVLIKDLRCGVSEKTINKVCKDTDWAIPVFECQLAKDSNDQPNKMKGRKRLECKLDGVRVLAVCVGDTVNLYSRNGKRFENFADIETQLVELTHELSIKMFGKPIPFVLDGEIIGRSFQDLMKQAQRKYNVNAPDSNYYIFDVIPLDDFRRGYWNAQQNKRIALLEKVSDTLGKSKNLHVMPGIYLNLDIAEGRSVMQQFAQESVRQGYEGIMIKNIDAPYECKRGTFWMKWKPTHDYDLVVVGLEEGTGKNKGRLGALVCEGVDSGRKICVNVGSGFSDHQRDDYWTNSGVVVGQTVVVECDAITQNQDGSYSLRFPRFKTFRDDK